jgi:hypothetical protein
MQMSADVSTAAASFFSGDQVDALASCEGSISPPACK